MNIGFDAKRLFHNGTGLGNYSRDLLRILSQIYFKNNYVLYNPKPKRIDKIAIRDNIKEILPKGFLNQKFSFYWRSKSIVYQLIEDNIQVYHGLSGELPFGIEKTNIKTLVTIHDLIFCRYPQFYSFFDRKIYFQKFLHAAKIADKIIAISEQTKKDIIHFLKVNPEKIQVIYQGCHPAFKEKYDSATKDNILKKYCLPRNFLLNVGTIEPRKNLLNLVKAIKDLNISLVVVGKKTNYYKKVLNFIKEHKIAYKVYFLQGLNIQELAALYQMAKIFIYPSIFEGFGIPIVEALYSKVPVITSKGSCFVEAGGEVSFYIDPLNVEDIKQKIQQLLSDKDLIKDTLQKIHLHTKFFNEKKIAQDYLDIYKEILQ